MVLAWRESNRGRTALIAVSAAAIGLGMLASVGCSALGPTTATTRPGAAGASGEASLFSPPPPPENFDPKWAHAKLSEIPNDPQTPPATAATAVPELPRQALRHLTEAGRLFAEQRYSETVSEAEQAIRYNAKNAEANRLAAVACLMLGKDEQARSYAEAAISAQGDDLASHYVLARIADKAEKAEQALTEYRTALKCPTAAVNASYRILTQYHLGLLLQELGFYRASVDQLNAFQQAAGRLGDAEQSNAELAAILRLKRLPVLQSLTDSYESLGQFGPAADAIAAALQIVPDDNQLRVRQVKDLVRAERFDAAASQAAALASASEGSLKSVELLLAVHRASGHPERGLAALRQLVQQEPDNVGVALLYTDALVEAKRYDTAVQLLNDVVRKHPDASAARWKLVAIHRFQGNLSDWLGALAGELASEPTDTTRALAELAELSQDKAGTMVDEALAKPMGAITSAPAEESQRDQTAARYFCLGFLADRLDRVDNARVLFARSLQADGNFMPAVTGIAELYIRRCQWDKALDILKPTESDDALWQARLSQLEGRCYDGLDNTSQAVKCYDKAIAAKPADTETTLLLARLYDRSNQPKEAARLYEKIIANSPESVEVRELLVMNLLNRWSEGNNLKQAIAELTDMQKQAPEAPATMRTTALVRMLLRNQDLAGYVKVLTALIENHPKDLKTRRTLCMALYRSGDYAAAMHELEPLLKAEPRNAEANEIHMMVLLRQLKIDEAADQIAKCLKWYPNREGFLRNLAEVELVRQDYPKAEALWNHLLSLKSNEDRHPLYRRRLIVTYLQAGWYDRARAAAEKWLVETPDVAAYRSYLLAADAAEGKYDIYLKRCRDWLEKDHHDAQAREWLLGIGKLPGQAAGGLIGAGQPAEAVAQATAWAAESPTDARYQVMLLETLRAAGRTEDAENSIEICRAQLASAEKLPQQMAALQGLAEAYLLAKQYDKAISTVKEMGARGAKLTETDFSFGVDQLLVSYLAQAKRYGDAIAQGNKLVADLDERETRLQQVATGNNDMAHRLAIAKEQERLGQQKSNVLRSLAFVHTRQKGTEQAIDCLRQALKLTPNDAGINNDLGFSLADAGVDLVDAEHMLNRAVAEVIWLGVGEDDRQAAFTDSLGWLYYKQGLFPQARQWLALSAKMEDGEDPVIYDHLGDADWRTGQFDAARQAWKKCLELQKKQVANGKADPDEALVKRVNAKLEASKDRKAKTPVATSVAD